jgi:hypothetical protein
MKFSSKSLAVVLTIAAVAAAVPSLKAALLAYEPFNNAAGTAIIGSSGGSGFSGAWQSNSSGGTATNTSYALTYIDRAGNSLVTAGGAGFFQGSTSGSTAMQPYRLFSFARGTNGTDGGTTWISFLVVRQGPTGTSAGNPYGRGANVCHDVNAGGSTQKLAIGNSSGAASNTVGLIPQGASGNLKPSTNRFGPYTNFVVVRIDHKSGALDNAWLFVNPGLAAEPAANAASTNSLGGFDFTFDRLRMFAGGTNSTSQPYAEMVVDEYRVGETYADVAPYTSPVSPTNGPLVITNIWPSPNGVVLAGTGGSNAATYYVLSGTSLALPSSNWPAIATNTFRSDGSFRNTNPPVAGASIRFFRLMTGQQPPVGPLAPFITTPPQSQSVTAGNNALFTVVAGGDAPLFYRWYFNTNTFLAYTTGASLTVTNTQNTNAGTYSVIVSNNVGTASSVFATLTVNPAPVAPSIGTQPQSLTVTQGQNATFTVAADGTSPLRYRWYFNTNTALINATNSSFAVTNALGTNAGNYSVIITNVAGSITSSYASLTVLIPPYITTQPQDQTVTASNNATFTVVAGGTAPLTYRWYFNTNTLLAYAAGASVTVTNVQTANAGIYSVVVSGVGSVTSAFATLTVNTGGLVAGAYFVSPSGNDNNSGSIDLPFLTISKGLTTIGNGGVLYLRGGTYALSSKLSLSQTASPANRIRIWAYPGETPFINSTGNSSDGISISGNWYHLKGLVQAYAGHNGINISGNSNIVENCTVHDNGNTGLHITGGQSSATYPAYNFILNCDAYLNYDPPVGGNADGFSAKWDLGPGNMFSGCRSWWNSDDGWDLWMGNSPVVISNCWAFFTGTNYWNSSSFKGNANGFKLGGNNIAAAHRLVRCLSFLNQANGVDQNNNTAGLTVDNVTSWANVKANFALAHGANTTPHVVRNCISLAGGSSDSYTASPATLATNNAPLNILTDVNTSDFQSIDASQVMGPRQADGSLPDLPFLKPVAGGRLIDKGCTNGVTYMGNAPDLGWFEVQ